MLINSLIAIKIRAIFFFVFSGTIQPFFTSAELVRSLYAALMINLLLEGSRAISIKLANYFDLRTQIKERVAVEFGLVGLFTFLTLLVMELLPMLINRPYLLYPRMAVPAAEMQTYRVVFTFGIITFLFIHALRAGSDLYQRWHKSLLEAEKLKKENMEAQFDMLRNQINPHFLFNNLNALSSLIYTDQDAAARFVEELSGVYRYLLENKYKTIVPLKTEIAFIDAYIFLLKVRFRENLKFDIKIPEQYHNRQLPPLTLQMLVENAIKHNIVSREEPLSIKVFVDEKEYLVVSNNLQRRPDTANSTGTGLNNIISRYRYFTGKPVHISTSESCFTAQLPLLQESN